MRPAVKREADWIVHKAMEVDVSRRYQTVDALAEDVRRLLDGRAVLPHPPSRGVHGVAGGAQAAADVGSGDSRGDGDFALSVVASVQAVRLGQRSADLAAALETANEQRARAEKEEERQRVLSNRLVQAMTTAANDDRFVVTTDQSPLIVLRRMVAQLGPDDKDDTIAEAYMRLGFAHKQARNWDEALKALIKAQEASDRVDHPWSERSQRIAAQRVYLLRELGRLDESLTSVDDAIARSRQGASSPFLAALYWERLYTLDVLKVPFSEIRAAGDDLIAAIDRFPERLFDRARAREEPAAMAVRMGHSAVGEALIREALALADDREGEQPVNASTVSRLNHILAFALLRQSRWAEAEPPARAAAEYRLRSETARGGRGHRFSLLHAVVLHRLGRFAEAIPQWEMALIRPLSEICPNELLVAQCRLRLAAARLAIGDVQAGRVEISRALTRGRIANPDHADIRALVEQVEAALRVTQWQVDDRVKAALGALEWMADPPKDYYYGPIEGADPAQQRTQRRVRTDLREPVLRVPR